MNHSGKPSGAFFLNLRDIEEADYCPICYWEAIIQRVTSRELLLRHLFSILGLLVIVFVYQMFFGDYFLNASSWLFLGTQFIFKLIPQIIVLLLLYSILFKAPRIRKQALEYKQKIIELEAHSIKKLKRSE
jgi:hypothetical protein